MVSAPCVTVIHNDACVGQCPLTSEVPKDRVMVIWHMVGCWRTRARTGIVRTEKGSIQLVMFDDQLCICGASRAEMEMELDL